MRSMSATGPGSASASPSAPGLASGCCAASSPTMPPNGRTKLRRRQAEIRTPKAEDRRKTEDRNPKKPPASPGMVQVQEQRRTDNGAPKPHAPVAGAFGLRASAFLRFSGFGLRICQPDTLRYNQEPSAQTLTLQALVWLWCSLGVDRKSVV